MTTDPNLIRNFSIKMCIRDRFMPRSPETHAKLPVVREAESALPVERWVAELVEAAEVRDYACPAYKPKPRRDAGGAGQGGAEDTARA